MTDSAEALAPEASDDLPKSHIQDYISGERIRATPEEVGATQPFSRSLVEDYGYPKSHLRTRPQFKVKSSPSDNVKSYPVDIAVFTSPQHLESELSIIVEAKKPNRFDGEEQLRDYMRFSKASLGVWTNGDERSFWHKIVGSDGVDFRQIPNIPRYGQSLASVGKYTKQDLVPPTDLKAVFRSMRNHLAANVTGTSRDEVLAVQLINLVFCKIFDERFTSDTGLLDFRIAPDESFETVTARLSALFGRVKAKYSEVFGPEDELSLDPASVAYAVGELQGYSLLSSSRDAVGEAFETFVSATLKGAQGQFFTPRNVVSTIVELISPTRDELVIDPACGAAGFLVESLRHKWALVAKQAKELGWSEAAVAEERQEVAMKTIFGIEKDELLSKVAKAYMAIMGDGKGSIFSADSLERPSSWATPMRSQIALGKFDVVLANPPFGKDIKVTGQDKLGQYDLAYSWQKGTKGYIKTQSLKKRQNPQTLFIERCLQLLRPGGRLGIILPESFFHAPSNRAVLQYLTQHNIVALFDLPHNTFRPFNNAKCIALILEKDRPQQDTIQMVVAEEMGHDHLGRQLYRWDSQAEESTDEIWDDTERIISELRGETAAKYVFKAPAKDVIERGILIPRYYWPERNVHEQLDKNDAIELITVGKLVQDGDLTVNPGHGSPAAKYKGRGNMPYIRVKDIINWEVYKDPTARIPSSIYKQLIGERKLSKYDVVMVGRGSYRIGDVAMIGPESDVALTREVLVFRSTSQRIDPFYLLYLLSQPEVRTQIETRVFIDTTLPTLGGRWSELELPVHKSNVERERLGSLVASALQKRWDSMEEIIDIRESMGVLTNDAALSLDALTLAVDE